MDRYRRIYGKTHDTVHIRDEETNRRIIDEVKELNTLNEIIDGLYHFIKEQRNELVRVEDDYGVKWFVTTPEDIVGYVGEADIKTYDEYLESLKKQW